MLDYESNSGSQFPFKTVIHLTGDQLVTIVARDSDHASRFECGAGLWRCVWIWLWCGIVMMRVDLDVARDCDDASNLDVVRECGHASKFDCSAGLGDASRFDCGAGL
ncbi:hypothetical protein BC351_37425 [Paenibacillus ferrarius]|uniref:Uncharacterized protein n=1 Tax=Paenibacillus ferrarius TaxID=1469647 RepID=A0A1V4HBC1_9BACL|nr:hypothetical protein BC351_37425 [Paenibacillus ferrarius]